MTLRKREFTGKWKEGDQIALCAELALEEAYGIVIYSVNKHNIYW